MANVEPFEIIVAPYQVWTAPTATAFPDVDTAPPSPWVLLGKNGNLNMDEAGVIVSHPQTINQIRVYGSTGPRKAVRSAEDLTIAFNLYDTRLDDYTRVINNGTITTVAAGSGTPGYQQIGLARNAEVATVALLVRGSGPEGVGASADWDAQYEIPTCYQNGSPTVTYIKTDGAKLAFEYMGLFDTAQPAGEEFGRLIVQDADALP